MFAATRSASVASLVFVELPVFVVPDVFDVDDSTLGVTVLAAPLMLDADEMPDVLFDALFDALSDEVEDELDEELELLNCAICASTEAISESKVCVVLLEEEFPVDDASCFFNSF